METERERLNILVIGDDTETARVVANELARSNTRCRLMSAPKSASLACLRREGRYADAPRPDLVMFDAVELDDAATRTLREIKADPACRGVPVVLLSREESADVPDGIRLGDTYYSAFSPVDLDSFLAALNAMSSSRFMKAIALLENYGFVLVRVREASSLPELEQGKGNRAARRPRSARGIV